MIVFGLIVFLLALAAIAFIAWPIAAGAARKATPVAANDPEAVFEATLSAIDRDRDYGLIDDPSAEEAKREAQAEIQAGSEANEPASAATVSRRARFAAFVALGATPFAAVLLYLYLGEPEALGVAPQTSGVEAAEQPALAAASQQRIQMLEMQVATDPSNFEGWMQLGVEYISSGQAGEAARAFGRAVEIDATNAGALGAYGEALVQQAQGAVTGEARALFEKAVAISPNDPRAQYYLAEARYQVGAVDEAARGWAKMLNSAPSDAPWFAAVAARMSDAAAEAGLDQAALGLDEDVATRLAAASQTMPGVASAAAGGGGGDDFNTVIGRIHDGSASYEDWINAAATYAERGETDRAKEMLDSAAGRYEKAPFVLAEIEKAKAQLEAGEPIGAESAPAVGGVRNPTADQVAEISQMSEGDQREMIAGMVTSLAERLKSEPNNLEGWRMLARSYRVLGEPDKSAAAWRELLSRTKGGSEDWRGLAFALLEQRPEGDNSISEELEEALENIRKASPNDPLALYNLGYAAYNRGDKKRALTMWTRLRDSLPAEAPIGPTLERLIADAQTG